MNNSSEIPSSLKPDGEGARLWSWLCENVANVEANLPLAIELCITADRLQDVRSKITQQGLTISGPKGRPIRHPLLDVEARYAKALRDCWRVLGLADKSEPEQGSLAL
jgi:hypothetical protein